MNCRIRLAQVDTTLGNLSANLDAHLVEIDRASAAGIDVLVFPELSLTGYFLKDQAAEVALSLEAPELASLAHRSAQVSIALGFVERAPDGRLYNSVGFFEDGRLLHVHRKVHLVNYGMFEESRDLAAGGRFEPLQSKHGCFGLLTCEDMWHVGGGYLYFLDGVDAILIPSASPGRGVTGAQDELESNATWESLQDAMALFFRTWILYVNRVGWEDGVVFGGNTRAVDPFGREAGSIVSLDPGCLDVDLRAVETNRARVLTPLRRDERPGLMLRELSRRFSEKGDL